MTAFIFPLRAEETSKPANIYEEAISALKQHHADAALKIAAELIANNSKDTMAYEISATALLMKKALKETVELVFLAEKKGVFSIYLLQQQGRAFFALNMPGQVRYTLLKSEKLIDGDSPKYRFGNW